MAINVQIATPITLFQYAQGLPQTSMARIFVENMVAESDVMRTIPILPAQNGKRAFLDIADLPSVGFRGINEAGNESTGHYNLREEDTFFIDEYVKYDRALVDRLGPGGEEKQVRLKSIALAQMYTQKLIKGDTTSNPREPTGLQARCNIAGINLFHNSTASGGAALSLANLDLLYWQVNKPTHWIVPRGLMPYFDIAARSNSLTNQTLAYTKDDFGRQIMAYKGLPLLFGYEPDDSPDMLPFTEVASGGGAAVTSSIYLASFRDGGLYGIEQTPLSIEDEGRIVGQPFFSTHIKWDWGIAREHPRSIARLDSITAATLVA
jgi:hypothetical protein